MSEEKVEANNQIVIVEGQLSKIIHQEGTGDFPKKGQQVHALYRGTLTTGEQFDSNQNRDNPFKFTLGQGQVIKGWDEGFASMRKGEKATLICSPDYAYGKRGSPPKIPPNSTLNFEVQLLDFNDKKKEKWDLSLEEKIQEATKFKNEGNELLKSNDLAKAISKYNDGIQYVDFQEDEKAKAILKILRMNASQAHLKAHQYAKSIQICTKVLKDDQNNLKTLYRRGLAYLGNKDYDQAKNDFELLLKLDPTNAEAQQQLAKTIKQKRQSMEKEKNFLKGMFSKSGLYDDKKPKPKPSKPAAKDETDSENEEMPELEKDEEGVKNTEATEKSEKESEHKHEHHGGNCC